ncbi:unnamed protein product [Oikopleura dioica]|uniref:Uncharacterized protein n=1 Tax=Oikopleura dioica TaxID=34765 RepID=E4WXX5_OIKDI|nr:unnamed protein product [Oikopleura dioica]
MQELFLIPRALTTAMNNIITRTTIRKLLQLTIL